MRQERQLSPSCKLQGAARIDGKIPKKINGEQVNKFQKKGIIVAL